MRRFLLLLCILAFAIPAQYLFAQDGGKEGDNGGSILRRSIQSTPSGNTTYIAGAQSYPGGPLAKAPLATGYYVVDNDAPSVPAQWTPTYNFIDTTGVEARAWRRILSGPNQRNPAIWTAPGTQGYEYFRNPTVPADSTDNAIAGPINIGFPFYYYGRAYDSFYVSTNGLIALANRRYQYDEAGNRVDYNPFRDDSLSRPRAGLNAVVDPTPDDYGFSVVAMGGSTNWPQTTTGISLAMGGIRAPTNDSLHLSTQKSIIAPLWDDQELSQFDTTLLQPDDFGRVYWRRDNAGNRLIIYFVNMSMKNVKAIPLINTTAQVRTRQIRANVQVVLDRIDSSIQFNYVQFLGQYVDPGQGIVTIPANSMYRANATIGIQSNEGEWTSYQWNDNPAASPSAGKTVVNGVAETTPHAGLAIKFRQWANKVRVMKVDFQIPNRNNATQFVSLPNGVFPANYELLLGNPILGVIRPVGIVQNVSDSIGPVNRTPQPVRFNMVFRIRDLVNVTNPPVYQKTNVTDSLHPIRVGTKNTDTVIFDPYVTNAQLTKQSGRFKAEVIATDRGPNGEIYGDFWPFDDTTGTRIFGVSRVEIPYITTFNDFSVSPEDGIIPNVHRWVSIGTKVVDGDQNTWNPPPPRGPASGSNGNVTMQSPVMKMDRQTVEGAYYQGSGVGDTLISFPVNLSGATNPVIFLEYQRAGKQVYPRNWSDQVRLGPEHAVYDVLKTGFYQQPDILWLEFAEPSPNGLDNIVNVQSWRQSSFGDPTGSPRFASNSPRWAIFGGGGGTGKDTTGKIIVDEFDPGKDFEFFRAYIPVPKRWSADVNTNKTFRFRLMVRAKDDKDPVLPADDEDAFYVDNIYLNDISKPELEVTTVGTVWPYTIAPASQARAVPIYVKVANNGSTAATSFGVAMYITQGSGAGAPQVYYRFRSVISLGAGQDRKEFFPTWNAQECGTQIVNPDPKKINSATYRIYGEILPKGSDSYSANDLDYTDFTLSLGSVFAYDDTTKPEGTNDVPGIAGTTGKGLNLVAPNEDYQGSSPYGPIGGNLSGSFAAQFQILTRDTVRGFQAYYGGANQSPDYVLYSLYRGTNNPNDPPDTVIKATRRYARRGEGIPTKANSPFRDFYYDQYVTYTLDTEYVVDPGIYFVTVSQLGETGLELGASTRNEGQVTTIYDPNSNPPGTGNYSIAAHPEMRTNIRFWYEEIAESGTWHEMLQPTTNPGYPNHNYGGVVTTINTYTRGSWTPMIRPYFGAKEAGTCTVLPVELAAFDVTPAGDALRLDWKTATEINNAGFYVERREKGADNWNSITFKAGAGTSNHEIKYSHVDSDVKQNVTYQYRLRQQDRDGAIQYSAVREGRIAGATTGEVGATLAQNSPNPFSAVTTINFTMPHSGNATLAIYDVYGNTVRSYDINAQAGVTGSVIWDGRDANGTKLANGIYVYKLVGDGVSLSRKMTIAR